MRILTLGTIIFLLISVVTTATTIYYHQKYEGCHQKYRSLRRSVVQVSVIIDYGNGTSTTDSDVYLFTDANVLDALRAVANVNATYWEAYKSFFVDGINDVFNDFAQSRFWVFSVNGEHALVSADQYILEDGDEVEWTYEHY